MLKGNYVIYPQNPNINTPSLLRHSNHVAHFSSKPSTDLLSFTMAHVVLHSSSLIHFLILPNCESSECFSFSCFIFTSIFFLLFPATFSAHSPATASPNGACKLVQLRWGSFSICTLLSLSFRASCEWGFELILEFGLKICNLLL